LGIFQHQSQLSVMRTTLLPIPWLHTLPEEKPRAVEAADPGDVIMHASAVSTSPGGRHV
jgi:hypothetical protein